MPELPELQAHAERLDAAYRGATLERFHPLTFTALKTVEPSPDKAFGQALAAVGRRGKHLLLDFGDITFVVHLMQGGRLKEDTKHAVKPRGGLARWRFRDGRDWLLTEAGHERRAGIWVVVGDPAAQPPLAGLGPEADSLSPDQLLQVLHAHPMRLHGLLREQHLLAGVGRRLANEICHRARLSPYAATAKLGASEAGRLVDSIRACVAESLEYERGRDDMSSSADRSGSVHHRHGEPCPVCGDTIRTVEFRAYTVAYCPTCQTNGKVLADNTTSKFLK
jgi:formamidopyrimidine-DNA glycosylase